LLAHLLTSWLLPEALEVVVVTHQTAVAVEVVLVDIEHLPVHQAVGQRQNLNLA
jgi:hypothetical protein